MPFQHVRTFFLVGLFLGIILYGCSPAGKSVVWKQEKVDFSKYEAVFIQPVFNETGTTDEDTTAAQLTDLLKTKLPEKGVRVIHDPQVRNGILTVQGAILEHGASGPLNFYIAFAGLYGAKTVQITVRTKLFDKSDHKFLGEVVTTKEAASEGNYAVGAPEWILQEAATEITEEISRILKGEPPK